jgi:hypothetical protein
MEISRKIPLKSLYLKTINRHEAEIKGLIHPAQTNLGHFLAWFQSLQLSSTQSESPLALIRLSPKSHMSLKSVYSTMNIIFHFSYFDPDYPISIIIVTGLPSVYYAVLLNDAIYNI